MRILENKNGRIAICEECGAIVSLTFEGKEYVGGKAPLFTVGYRSEEGDLTRVTSNEMTCTGVEGDESALKISFEWEGVRAVATVALDKHFEFGISVTAREGYITEWVNYPELAVPDDMKDKGGNSKILWGFNEGSLVDDMSERERGHAYYEPEYPCRGLMGVFPAVVETQFMAYYDDRSGLYIASHDNKNNLKGINYLRRWGGITLEFKHYTGADFGETFTMDYPMVVEFFHGDYYDACEIYRSWFEVNKTPDFKKIPDNPKIPKWYSESPVVITYPVRGTHDMDEMFPNKLFPYINVMPHVERYEKLFGSKIMVLLMHWEGTAPWAPPIVWPPYGGEEKLRELIDALHERGDVLGVYCSGLGWTMKSNVVDDYNTYEQYERENLKEEMCISPKGEIRSNICQGQRVSYDMCPSRDFTVNTIVDQVKSMVSAGIDYVQLMDQNHGGTAFFCYSKNHAHPPVPGKWQADAVKRILSTANEYTGQVLLGCESAAAESYIPNLLFSDNRYHLNYGIGRPVPAYAYVYHEYLNNFLGNQVSADWFYDQGDYPETFYERIVYSFIAGDVITVVIDQDGKMDWCWGKRIKDESRPDQERIGTLVKNLNWWRQSEYKKYVHLGKMVKPLAIECGEYEARRYKGKLFTLPKVHTSAFLASDGSYGQFFATYMNGDEEFTVNIPTDGYTLVYHDGKEVALEAGVQTIKVPALSAVLIKK